MSLLTSAYFFLAAALGAFIGLERRLAGGVLAVAAHALTALFVIATVRAAHDFTGSGDGAALAEGALACLLGIAAILYKSQRLRAIFAASGDALSFATAGCVGGICISQDWRAVTTAMILPLVITMFRARASMALVDPLDVQYTSLVRSPAALTRPALAPIAVPAPAAEQVAPIPALAAIPVLPAAAWSPNPPRPIVPVQTNPISPRRRIRRGCEPQDARLVRGYSLRHRRSLARAAG